MRQQNKAQGYEFRLSVTRMTKKATKIAPPITTSKRPPNCRSGYLRAFPPYRLSARQVAGREHFRQPRPRIRDIGRIRIESDIRLTRPGGAGAGMCRIVQKLFRVACAVKIRAGEWQGKRLLGNKVICPLFSRRDEARPVGFEPTTFGFEVRDSIR